MLWLFGSERGVEPGDTVEAVCPECGLIRHCVEVIQISGFSVWFIPITKNKKVCGYVCQVCGTHFETPGELNIELITQISETMVKESNEAAHIANNDANSKEIRLSQLRLAQEKLAELERIGVTYPFVELTTLKGFKHSLAGIESEIMQSK